MENSYKCIPCTLYIVLLTIIFTINIGGIVTYYLFSQYYRKKYLLNADFNAFKETTIY